MERISSDERRLFYELSDHGYDRCADDLGVHRGISFISLDQTQVRSAEEKLPPAMRSCVRRLENGAATLLDAFKATFQLLVRSLSESSCRCSPRTVSYTHLDVYKRQGMTFATDV